MNLEISIEYAKWNKVGVKKIVRDCVDSVFSELELERNNVEICFLFTNNDEVQTLNKTYRGINKPTNVLSFPADSISSEEYDFDEDEPTRIIGSAAFAYETIERESQEQQKSFSDHLNHLVVHSVLHLLGYDHADEREAEEMEGLEISILKKLNIANPYE